MQNIAFYFQSRRRAEKMGFQCAFYEYPVEKDSFRGRGDSLSRHRFKSGGGGDSLSRHRFKSGGDDFSPLYVQYRSAYRSGWYLVSNANKCDFLLIMYIIQ
jgi:hypothetical protein